MHDSQNVVVSNRYKVCCMKEGSWKSLAEPFRLGPIDQLIFPVIPMAVIFAYESPSEVTLAEFMDIERLKTAVSYLLDYYPHLTGRLQINAKDAGSPEIVRLGTGAEILEAQCPQRLDAFIPPGRRSLENLPMGGNALLAPFDTTLETVCNGPILTIQHTRFACGGVTLGVRLLHVVSDGAGVFQLVEDMAELYRGLASGTPALSHPPHIQPYMSNLMGGAANLRPEELQEVLDYQPAKFHLAPEVDAVTGDSSSAFRPPPHPVVGRFVHFSSRELQAIKAQATDPNAPPGSWVSTFDALVAHLYQYVYRARVRQRELDDSLDALSPPDILSPVDLRNRLGPDAMPKRYFGNAGSSTFTCVPPDVLATAPLWEVAKVVHDMTRTPETTAREEIDSTLRWLALQPDKRRIRSNFRYGSGSLMVSQWNKFDMYKSGTFDVKPVLVSTPFTTISLLDGLGYLLPAPEEEGDTGAIVLALALGAPLWDILDSDVGFRRYA
ncbi:hypothetical protein CYLTODRAFT_372540 [Cylindrobasidium torrendii FP15055 ss-10]|uniref:Transferase-domain-containing protein n=1 Tax=Cylindrobasidium torrendii FP15055 ss-10 TaxID=1314674 RepID=A0A0D7BG73_9AGAR|nr:hypothetical protein CYLTODRAFT_372540 [Cylindrobasidium torrendii FP15055 ss-10]